MARGGVRNPFTEREEAHLVEYMAKVKPTPAGRLGNKHFEALEDTDAFPWAKYHPWQSWRERYKKNQENFDRKIRRFQKAKKAQKEKQPKVIESDEEDEEDKQEGSSTRVAAIKPVAQASETEDRVKEGRREKGETLPRKTNETPFVGDDDKHLVQYIAESKASIQARQGYSLYQALEGNADNLWPWAKRHTWQSWRQRYMDNQQPMNESILRLQKRSRQRTEASKTAEPAKEPNANIEDKSTHVEASQEIQRPEKVKRAGSATVDAVPKAKPLEEHRQPLHMVRGEVHQQNPPGQSHVAVNTIKPERAQYRKDDRTAFQQTGEANPLSEAPQSNQVNIEANHNQPRQPSMPPIKTLVDDDEVADSQEEDSPVYEEHDTMLELFGPDIDELDEDENGVVEETPPPRPREVVAPQVSQEPTPPKSEVKNVEHAPSPQIPRMAHHTPAKKPKPKRRSQTEDFFRSSSSPPPVAKKAVATTRGNPPMYVEGAFRTTLKRVRSREDELETAWPPKRLKKNPVSADKDTTLVDDPDKQIDVIKKESPKTTMQQPPKVNGAVARPPQGHQVNAVASSSKVKLPESPTRQEKQRRIPPHHVTKKHSPVIPQVSATTAARQLAPPSKKDAPLVPAETSKVAPITKPNQTKAVPAVLAVSRSRSGQTISPGTVSDGDVFRVSGQSLSEKAKGKARAEYVLDTRPPRIDLHRQSLQRRMNTSVSMSTTKHSTSSSRTSSVSASSRRINRARQSISGVVLPAESVTALAEQMLSIVTNIAHKYSVSDDVALTTFLQTGSLEKTQAVLMGREYGMTDEDSLAIFLKVKTLEKTQVVLMGHFYGIEEKTALNTFKKWRTLERTQVALERYNKAMFEADAAMTKEMPEWVGSGSGDEEGDSEDAPSGLVPREVLAAKERRDSGGNSKINSRGSRGRQSLTIRPLPDDEDDERLSDYAPPSQSRAGQFARLVRQGRTEEAKERERRRLSIPLAQPRRQPSLTVSPTPHSRVQSLSQMLDMQMDIEMGDINEHDVNGVNVEEEGTIAHGDVVDNVNGMMEEEEEEEEEQEQEEQEEQEVEKPAAAVPEEEEEQEEEQATAVVPEEEESYEYGMMEVENPEESQVVEEEDDDDIYMPDIPYPGQQQVAENEQQDQQESSSVGSLSPPRSPQREESASIVSLSPPRSPPTLLERVSGGKAKDASFLALAEEHRGLALDVDAENHQKLRAFEAKNNPDLLRLWSIKWAKEMMENYHERFVAEQPEIIEISD